MNKSSLIPFLEKIGITKISRYKNRNRPMILMYHRIIENNLIPGIRPNVFKMQMTYLKNKFNLITLDQLHSDLLNNSVKPYSIAITFDDAHYDFYENAWPILKSLEIPATLFLPTNFIDQKSFLWPDLLRYLIFNSQEKDITFIKTKYHLNNQKQQLWNQVGDYCLTLKVAERDKTIAQLAKSLKVDLPEKPVRPYCSSTWEQIKEMTDRGLLVGSHSLTHPILSHLTTEEINNELLGSKRRIENVLEKTPIAFCYPNGMPKDIPIDALNIAKIHYQYAVTAFPNNLKNHYYYGRYAAPITFNAFKKLVNGLELSPKKEAYFK